MLGIVLLGRSNSGKSTIGKNFADTMAGMRYISSGDIARNMSDEIKEILNQGELAPENIMRERILDAIDDSDKDFVLDGFPRFLDQYDWLNQVTSGIDFIYVVVNISREEAMCRAERRGRDDDDAINKKMQLFDNHTQPMIDEIIQNETVHIINNGDSDCPFENVMKLRDIVEEYYADDSEI